MSLEPEPFDNVPVRHPNGQDLPLTCEVRVYSGERADFGGHQCQNIARWRIAGFDKWGDILVCGRHRTRTPSRSTHSLTLFGAVKGAPSSVRWYGYRPPSSGDSGEGT